MTQPFKRDIRLHPKAPHVNHVRDSYPILLRDAILTRIKLMPFFTGFTFKSNMAVQAQPDDIPQCAVYFLQETMTPDGDANTGEVRFTNMVQIGISVIIQNNDSVASERKLDAAYQVLMITLLTDTSLQHNEQFEIEAFTTGQRSHHFGNAVKDNEVPMAELRLELNIDLGVVTYEPEIVDVLETIHVETLPPEGDGNTTRIISVYDIDQGS